MVCVGVGVVFRRRPRQGRVWSRQMGTSDICLTDPRRFPQLLPLRLAHHNNASMFFSWMSHGSNTELETLLPCPRCPITAISQAGTLTRPIIGPFPQLGLSLSTIMPCDAILSQGLYSSSLFRTSSFARLALHRKRVFGTACFLPRARSSPRVFGTTRSTSMLLTTISYLVRLVMFTHSGLQMNRKH